MRVRPFDVQLAHVRDVEHAAAGANGHVLGDDALVLDGHLPAGERHHPRSGAELPLVERRPAQVGYGGVHGRGL